MWTGKTWISVSAPTGGGRRRPFIIRWQMARSGGTGQPLPQPPRPSSPGLRHEVAVVAETEATRGPATGTSRPKAHPALAPTVCAVCQRQTPTRALVEPFLGRPPSHLLAGCRPWTASVVGRAGLCSWNGHTLGTQICLPRRWTPPERYHGLPECPVCRPRVPPAEQELAPRRTGWGRGSTLTGLTGLTVAHTLRQLADGTAEGPLEGWFQPQRGGGTLYGWDGVPEGPMCSE